jgi:cytoplasmic iron level regulating protein YaaA (DUF328/UPF0246 family)
VELVLIACSDRKQDGGRPGYEPSKELIQGLSTESFEKLLELRSLVVKGSEKYLPDGPDVGSPRLQANAQYLPTFQRYAGIVYEYGRVRELYPGNARIQLVIISALYGLLDGQDLIQKYDLRMTDNISGQNGNTWWKQHGLGKIVEEYIKSYKPGKVYDLLPLIYRKALSSWPPSSMEALFTQYNYPGEGMGKSLKHRGRDLEKLLRS